MGYVWLAFTVVILVANVLVLLGRCTRRKEDRSSIPSILIINLAVVDFLLGVQILIYTILFKWPCLLLGNPKSFSLIQILCTVSALIEMISIPLSGLITTTIAFYYTMAIWRMFCIGPAFVQGIDFSRTKIAVGLIIEWTLAIVVGSVMAASINKPGFLVRKELPIFTSAGETIIQENYILMACVPIVNVGSLHKDHSPLQETVTGIPLVVTFTLLVLSFLAAVAYTGILVRYRPQSQLEVSILSVRHLRLRLAVVAFLPVIIWIAYVLLVLQGLTFASLMIISTLAIVNPFALTIISSQFLRSVQNFWIVTCKKVHSAGETPVLRSALFPTSSSNEFNIETGSTEL